MMQRMNDVYNYFAGTGKQVPEKKNQEDDVVEVDISEEEGWSVIGQLTADQQVAAVSEKKQTEETARLSPATVDANISDAAVELVTVPVAGMEQLQAETNPEENADCGSEKMEEELADFYFTPKSYPEGKIQGVTVAPHSPEKTETFAGFFSTLFSCCQKERLLDQVEESASPVRHANGRP